MSLTADSLAVTFAATDAMPLAALGPVSFTIEAGTFVALLGPSGCGKSTLIRVLGGLQKPSSGSASIANQVIDGPRPEVALMFQDPNLMPWRTVQENIALPLELAGMEKPQCQKRVHAILPFLGLQGFAASYPSELSGGMAQRVALGRVLVQDPDVVLLDEPFGALDAMTREKISLDLLRIWGKYHQTTLMVTHDINEAVLLADRIMILSRRPGRLIADIPVSLERPRVIEMIYTPEFVSIAREVREAIDHA